MNNTSFESFVSEGCGRCERYQTPRCKVHRWSEILHALRALLAASELGETMKWGFPTYVLDGKNVVMLTAFNDYCALSFFKGAALEDQDDGLLEAPGPNSHFSRLLKFQSMDDFAAQRGLAERLIAAAIAFERSGGTIERPDSAEPMPEELERRLSFDDTLRRAFEALTPGRQRSHILYVSGAKKAETREARVERCAPKIEAGKGFNEY